MRLSDIGVQLIKSFEGLRLNAYKDSAGVWTIGYGSTKYENGKAVKPGDLLSSSIQADKLFEHTLTRYEDAVNEGVKIILTQNQFDALVSLTYNVGPGVMSNSTLLKKLNAGDVTGAADQFLVWNKITDPVSHEKISINALSKRRFLERKLFLT
ncbi:lysozyme [Mucilaginibacter ginkgonis]|uniref:Lysozyme n=1 Tax=Mucilaginibacter ginkgonis TaxID=2682091 RepID=A0A6I4HVM8_9SPHI|nr:lysozyme [Mucilaginibacter ginkgonis]QQL50325.1 lysozyme [Mucilaginibacter ginkgonis]